MGNLEKLGGKNQPPRKFNPEEPPPGTDPAVWRLMLKFKALGEARNQGFGGKEFIICGKIMYCMDEVNLTMRQEDETLVQEIMTEFWESVWDGSLDPLRMCFDSFTWKKMYEIILQRRESRRISQEIDSQPQAPRDMPELQPARPPRHKLGGPSPLTTEFSQEVLEFVQDMQEEE